MDKPELSPKGIVLLPTTIKIMAPRRVGKAPRGRSAIYIQDTQHTFRMAQEKYAALNDAAEALGMTTAEFIRWVSYATANEVLRIERELKNAKPVESVRVTSTPYETSTQSQPTIPMTFDPYRKK